MVFEAAPQSPIDRQCKFIYRTLGCRSSAHLPVCQPSSSFEPPLIDNSCALVVAQHLTGPGVTLHIEHNNFWSVLPLQGLAYSHAL